MEKEKLQKEVTKERLAEVLNKFDEVVGLEARLEALEAQAKDPGRTDRQRERSEAKAKELVEEIKRTGNDALEYERALDEFVVMMKKAEHRAIIRMKYFDGNGWDEISESIYKKEPDKGFDLYGVPKKAMHSHSNAIAELASILASEWPDLLDPDTSLQREIEKKKDGATCQ